MSIERELGELRGLMTGMAQRFDDAQRGADEYRKLIVGGLEGVTQRMTRLESGTQPAIAYICEEKGRRERRRKLATKAATWLGGSLITAGTAHFSGLVDKLKWW